VLSGAHWAAVNGVETTGAIGLGQPYQINYFRISDPWTGFALTNPAQSGRILGASFETWIRYGNPWFSYFNPAPNGGNNYVLELLPQTRRSELNWEPAASTATSRT